MKMAMLMQPNLAPQETMAMLQQKMPMMFVIGIIENPVYGGGTRSYRNYTHTKDKSKI